METIFGVVYNICFVSCYWPQIIKSIKTRQVDDISISLFLLSVGGYISAAIYVYIKFGFDFWLLFNYSISLISAMIMIYIYYKYKKKHE